MERPEAYKDFDLTDRPGEVWLPVKDWEELYMVSSHGRLKSLGRKIKKKPIKILKATISKRGYLRNQLYNLSEKNKGTSFTVHRLIAQAFLGNHPTGKPFINHKNGIKTDNRVENLEWVSDSENKKHAFSIGLMNNEGINSPTAKVTEDQVRVIRNLVDANGIKTNRSGFVIRLAKEYNINPQTIYNIARRRTYKNVV